VFSKISTRAFLPNKVKVAPKVAPSIYFDLTFPFLITSYR